MSEAIYWLMTVLLLFSSLMVIVSSNSIYAVLFLILGCVSASTILLILKREFVSLIFVTIYVGAVAVLCLFVLKSTLFMIINSYYMFNKISSICSYYRRLSIGAYLRVFIITVDGFITYYFKNKGRAFSFFILY